MAIDVDADSATAVRALGDPLRWRIVELLAQEELCVCHLEAELDVPQPLVSHHLGVLRRAGLVEGERFRYWTYYRLRRGALAALAATIADLSSVGADQPRRRPCS